MKTLLMLVCFSAASLGLSLAKPPGAPAANATNRFLITGMHCQGCAKGLTSELKGTAGVAAAEVTLTNRLAVVAFDTNRVTIAALVKVIQEAGFDASLAKP